MRDGNQYVETAYLPTKRLVGASAVVGIRRPWNPIAAIAFGLKAEDHEVARFLDADADFIAAARQDIPALLDRVDAMENELAARVDPRPYAKAQIDVMMAAAARPVAAPVVGDADKILETLEDAVAACRERMVHRPVTAEALADADAPIRRYHDATQALMEAESRAQRVEDDASFTAADNAAREKRDAFHALRARVHPVTADSLWLELVSEDKYGVANVGKGTVTVGSGHLAAALAALAGKP